MILNVFCVRVMSLSNKPLLSDHPNSHVMPLSKAILLNLHLDQCSRGVSLQHRQLDILEAIGGIDKVLTTVLSSPVELSSREMETLHATMAERISIVQDDANDTRLALSFRETDTFAAGWFGLDKSNALLRRLNHRATTAVLVALWLVALVAYGLSPFIGLDVLWVLQSMFAVISALYMAVWLSFAHRPAFKLLMKNFVLLIFSHWNPEPGGSRRFVV